MCKNAVHVVRCFGCWVVFIRSSYFLLWWSTLWSNAGCETSRQCDVQSSTCIRVFPSMRHMELEKRLRMRGILCLFFWMDVCICENVPISMFVHCTFWINFLGNFRLSAAKFNKRMEFTTNMQKQCSNEERNYIGIMNMRNVCIVIQTHWAYSLCCEYIQNLI